ncbi:MAG TPA: AraC family transcriptional regulator [Bauldia sp.]|nr:AraC family transcriptional regulator [Bauldia sp.]
MDALSEALQSVRMTAAIFYNAEYTAPWGDFTPPAIDVAPVLAPGFEQLVIFHLVTEGRAVAHMDGLPDLPLEAGDIVIVPHGDAHRLSNGSPSSFRDDDLAIRKFLAGDLSPTRTGGGGELTRFVCGYFGCERKSGRQFLAGLPPMIRIKVRSDDSGAWLESSIRHLVSVSSGGDPGGMALLAKMAEALFVEALRRFARNMPAEKTGWLAAARDPLVGVALAALHREPSRHWTLPELAAAAGTSRSVLSDRFHHFLGESPMHYLARWRLQLASRLLQRERKSVMEVALDVGYESEAAFNRAFKREFGQPPAYYRRTHAGGARSAASRPDAGGVASAAL